MDHRMAQAPTISSIENKIRFGSCYQKTLKNQNVSFQFGKDISVLYMFNLLHFCYQYDFHGAHLILGVHMFWTIRPIN